MAAISEWAQISGSIAQNLFFLLLLLHLCYSDCGKNLQCDLMTACLNPQSEYTFFVCVPRNIKHTESCSNNFNAARVSVQCRGLRSNISLSLSLCGLRLLQKLSQTWPDVLLDSHCVVLLALLSSEVFNVKCRDWMELNAAFQQAMTAADPPSPELLLWATQHVWLFKNKEQDLASLGTKAVDIHTSMLV